MSICSLTLAAPGTSNIIGAAIASTVHFVDFHVVIDTGNGMDDEAYEAAVASTDKRVIRGYRKWTDDFSDMRNNALRIAYSTNANNVTWGLWADTDERIIGDGDAIRAYLASLPDEVCAVHSMDSRNEYGKERIIRLPRKGKYIGLTHEYFAADEGQIIASTDLVTFDELPRDRSGKAWLDKLYRDERLLQQQLKTDPDARWHYYLGDNVMLQGSWKHAAHRWQRCLNAPGWPEMKGWAAFRAASTYLEHGRHREAFDVALKGMAISPYPELLWAAAAASLKLGDAGNAVAWAQHAVAAGRYIGWGRSVHRSGFVWPPAQFEAPFDVMALAYDGLGMADLALSARHQAQAAKERREAA